jgi:ABC-type uncharacterized transport system ATPase component
MAIARDVGVVLLDEPTASLDWTNAQLCFAEIERMNTELGATILLVTHDLIAATRIGARLIVLVEGRIRWDIAGEKKKAIAPDDLFRLVEANGSQSHLQKLGEDEF